MPWEWHDLLNPLVFLGFVVWLWFELALVAVIVVPLAMILLWLGCGLWQLSRDMMGKR